MVRIIWTKTAVKDLKDIYVYISNDSKLYARRLVNRIRTKTLLLKKGMYIGNMTPETNTPTVRELHQNEYRIIYKVLSNNEVSVLTIHHNARKFNVQNFEE
jgi:toxin ParE1/3/4